LHLSSRFQNSNNQWYKIVDMRLYQEDITTALTRQIEQDLNRAAHQQEN